MADLQDCTINGIVQEQIDMLLMQRHGLQI